MFAIQSEKVSSPSTVWSEVQVTQDSKSRPNDQQVQTNFKKILKAQLIFNG